MHRRVLAALGATTVAAGVIAAGTMSADAATPRPSGTATQAIRQPERPASRIGPDHPWTINYHDSAGNITRVWHGTKAAATALGAQWRASHIGARPVAQPASTGIVKTQNCREPTTYWVFFNSGMTCYAYGGSLAIHLTGVYEIESGNNVGYYRIGANHYLPRYTSDLYSSGHTVVFIHID